MMTSSGTIVRVLGVALVTFTALMVFSRLRNTWYEEQLLDETEMRLDQGSASRGYRRRACEPPLKSVKYYSQSGEDRALYKKFFSNPPLCNGVYLEIGALDGLTYSNTKFFEDQLNWTGILIEAQPDNVDKLRHNRNKSHNVIVAEAVCPEGQKYVDFTAGGGKAVGGMPSLMTKKHLTHFFPKGVPNVLKVPCRPLGSMLKDAGISSIDIFILDVEGAELFVLQTMDWSVSVRLFVIEMGRGENDDKLIHLLDSHGYRQSQWNIRDQCPPKGDCARNTVFENSNFYV